MKDNSYHSYNIIRSASRGTTDESFIKAAEIALRHHIFQENGYPDLNGLEGYVLPNYTRDELHDMMECARSLSLLDSYEARMTRDNNRSKEDKELTPLELREDIINSRFGCEKIGKIFYNVGIFRLKKST